eukprot:1877802-Ditylum_brightwellii.AAC.1
MEEGKKSNVEDTDARTDIMLGTLDEVAFNSKITKTAVKKSMSAQEVAAAQLEKLKFIKGEIVYLAAKDYKSLIDGLSQKSIKKWENMAKRV